MSQRLLGESTAPRVGRYSLLGPVGRGAMGIVYGAYDEQLDRKVALKVHQGAAGDPRRREASLAEGRALASLSHPNVVAVHEVGVEGDSLYLAMEFVDGVQLGSFDEDDPGGREKLWGQLEATAAGLAAAHAAGLVHGDVKPSNVLVTAAGEVKVVDFGLARRSQEAALSTVPSFGSASNPGRPDETTVGRGFGGTPAYVAPEQATGKAMTPGSDQYAFAVMAWELLTGARPFAGGSVAAVLVRKSDGPPSLSSPGAKKLTRFELRALVRAMSPDPELRFSSIAALIQACRPKRSAKTLGIVLGAVAMLGLARAGAGQPEPPPPDPCVNSVDTLERLWPSERRAETGPSGDEPTRESSLRLDGLRRARAAALRWEVLARRSCEAHARGELEDPVFEAYRVCLDRTAKAVVMAATRMRDDKFDRARAGSSLTNLVAVELCASHRQALVEGELSTGKMSVQTDGVTINRANEVGHLWSQRKRDEARSRLPALKEALKASEDPFAIAEGYRQIGIVSESPASRRDALSMAMSVAMRHRIDNSALVSAGDLVAELSGSPAQRGEAQRVLEMILLWSDAILAGGEGEHLRMGLAPYLGQLHNKAGILASEDGRLVSARTSYLRALELWRPDVAWRPGRSAQALNNLALLASQMGEDDEAADYFSQALSVVEEHLGRDARIYEQVAANAADQAAGSGMWGRVEELLATMKASRAARDISKDSADMLVLRATRTWARGDSAAADTYLHDALELYRAKDRALMASLVELIQLNHEAVQAPVAAERIKVGVVALSKLTTDVQINGLARWLAADAALLSSDEKLAGELIAQAAELLAKLDVVSSADAAQLAMLRSRLALAQADIPRARVMAAEAELHLQGRTQSHPLVVSERVLSAELGTGPVPTDVLDPGLRARLDSANTAPPQR